MLPSFRRTSPAALPKAGTPRCYERLTATDVDLGYVLEHGELPSWHPQQRSIWRLRRSPLLWWGRWRLRKAQMLQNGSGRFEVGNHGQDLAFPSTSGAPEQLKPACSRTLVCPCVRWTGRTRSPRDEGFYEARLIARFGRCFTLFRATRSRAGAHLAWSVAASIG